MALKYQFPPNKTFFNQAKSTRSALREIFQKSRCPKFENFPSRSRAGEVIALTMKQTFDYYRSIRGFAEYLLVDQYSYYVKQFAKADDGRWWLSEYQDANDIVKFASLDFEIGLSTIYQEIDFD